MYRKTKKIGNNFSLFGLKYHYYICNIRNRKSVVYIEKISKFKNQRELLIDKNTMHTVLSRNGYLIELEVNEL